jgi:hypothetical protein
VTKGSSGIAQNTVPNVCKMPGPPAPFVPTPLPNIGMSGKSPQDYSTSVKIEGNTVAIRGASFGSTGDIASKGTGGGIISNNAEGPTKFIGPGSLNVKIEGKNVQLLSDPMMNNCGPSGSPPNAATLMGLNQADKDAGDDGPSDADCNKAIKLLEQPIRLAEKMKKKLPDARKAALRAKIAAGTITSGDLPGSIQNEFPPKLKGKTLAEVREICGKGR